MSEYPNIDLSGDVTIASINGNLNRGGWEVRFTSMNDTDIVQPYQYVQLYWDALFDLYTTLTDQLAFQGHVLPLQFMFDRMGSEASFIATTTDGILKMGWLQGIHFIDTDADPRDHYHQFDSVTGAPVERMTMGRIVRHILGYYDDLGVPPATNPDWVAHTNLVYHATENPHGWITLDYVTTEPFADPGNLEGSMRVDHYIVRETNNLWSTIQQIAKNEFFIAYFDKRNNLHYERHPMYADTVPDPVMEFDSSFMLAKPTVYVRHMDTVSDVGTVRQVRLHAVTDSGSTMHSEYPSSPTHVYGEVREISYLRCNSQDTLDHWAEVLYGFENRDFTVRVDAAGLCGLLFEVADRVNVTYTGTTANGVHVDWTNKKFWIHDITVDPGYGVTGKTTFLLEAEGESLSP